VLSDPLDPRQIFDENGNAVICAFKKTFRDDHVHKVRAWPFWVALEPHPPG